MNKDTESHVLDGRNMTFLVLNLHHPSLIIQSPMVRCWLS